MKLVIKGGKILATHQNDATVEGLYAGAEFAIVDKNYAIATDDPRSGLDSTELLNGIRSYRNWLMRFTDWTQAADSPLDPTAKSAWATWRSAMRDLPNHLESGDDPSLYGVPANPIWPTPPSPIHTMF